MGAEVNSSRRPTRFMNIIGNYIKDNRPLDSMMGAGCGTWNGRGRRCQISGENDNIKTSASYESDVQRGYNIYLGNQGTTTRVTTEAELEIVATSCIASDCAEVYQGVQPGSHIPNKNID